MTKQAVLLFSTNYTRYLPLLDKESTSPLLLRDASWNNKYYYCYLSLSISVHNTLNWLVLESLIGEGLPCLHQHRNMLCLWSLVLAPSSNLLHLG